MSKTWTTSGTDLHLVLPPRGPRRQALEAALRSAIREGRLTAGTRLPSTRALAVDLGIARGTVVEAYAQLGAEGYLGAKRGAGTWVAALRVDLPVPAANAARVGGGAPRGARGGGGRWAPARGAPPRGRAATAAPAGGRRGLAFHPGPPALGASRGAGWGAPRRRAPREAPDPARGWGD